MAPANLPGTEKADLPFKLCRERFAGKTSFATSSTLTGVIGLGLGVLQLAAAAACIVM